MTPDEILARFCKKLVALDMDIFGLRKEGAQDEEVWRTVGAKGSRRDGKEGGSHVLIETSTGEIKAGLGGKYTGMTVAEMKKKSKAETKQKKVASNQVVTKNIKSSDKLVQSFSALIESMNYEGKKFIGSLSPSLKKKIEEGIKINNEYLKKVQKAQTENEKKKLIEEFMDKNMDVLESNYLKEQEKIEQAIKQSEKTNNKFKSEKIVDWINAKGSTHSGGADSPEYTTPKGKKSPVPNLPVNSKLVGYLKANNFATTSNPVGDDDTKSYGQHGFEQKEQPTENDLISYGVYSGGEVPKGYWKGVPHVANAHPGLEPIGDDVSKVHDFDYNDEQEQSNYSYWAHNNVPNASLWGSAAGRAAAWSYTACSNTLNDTLREGESSQINKDWADDSAFVTKQLDKMFAVSRVKEPMVVYRGMDYLNNKAFFDMYKQGAVIESKSFDSTSVNPERAAQGFACPVWGCGLVKIRVPKGASALSVRYKENGNDFSKYAVEDEILLPRNTKYKVVGFEPGTGKLRSFKKIPILEIIP